jgi:hypothetical protein
MQQAAQHAGEGRKNRLPGDFSHRLARLDVSPTSTNPWTIAGALGNARRIVPARVRQTRVGWASPVDPPQVKAARVSATA